MNTIIYTCITNDYDRLTEIETRYRKICFTDQNLFSDTWEIVKLKRLHPKVHREVKIRPHRFLPPHDRNIWIDGNIYSERIDELIANKEGFWAMEHRQRYCLYHEGLHCIDKGKDIEENILPQLTKYLKDGYPRRNGLITSSVLIRSLTTKNIEFSDKWWKEVKLHSIRDQISFNYVAWKYKLAFQIFPYEHLCQTLKHNHQ